MKNNELELSGTSLSFKAQSQNSNKKCKSSELSYFISTIAISSKFVRERGSCDEMK